MNRRMGAATVIAFAHMVLTIYLANQWALLWNLTGGPGGSVPTTPIIGVEGYFLAYAAAFILFCISLLPAYHPEPHLGPVTLNNGLATGAVLAHASLTVWFWNEWSYRWDTVTVAARSGWTISWFAGYIYLTVFLLTFFSLIVIFFPRKDTDELWLPGKENR